MLNVSLIGHSTRSRNMGVGALTVSEIEILRRLAKEQGIAMHITVIDWKSTHGSYVSGSDVTIRDITGMDLLNPMGFFALVRKSDLVIDIGAGDSFADIYGQKRLARMFAMKYLVHLARRPLVIAPQTLGPFTKRLSTFLARQSIRMSAITATRDRLSTACAREMGVGARVLEASDVALRLPYTPPQRTPGGPVKVGLNISGLLMKGGYTNKNEFGLQMDYPALIRDLLRYFTTHPDGCEVHLVPHVITYKKDWIEDDYQPSAELAEEFPGVVLAPRFTNPSEAKSYIAGMDFFAGARMHACIAAFSSNVPVVPMAYSRKFAGLFGSLGYDHTVDCTSETGAAIKAKIVQAYENRSALEADRKAALARGLEKLALYETALGALIARQAGKR